MSVSVATLLLVGLLVLVAVSGTIVILTRDPVRQAIVLSAYGMMLGLVMLFLQAPDVAMSQLAVGAAVVPLLVVLTIEKCNREVRQPRRDGRDEQ